MSGPLTAAQAGDRVRICPSRTCLPTPTSCRRHASPICRDATNRRSADAVPAPGPCRQQGRTRGRGSSAPPAGRASAAPLVVRCAGAVRRPRPAVPPPPALPLCVRLRYEPTDPYVVRAVFFVDCDEPVEWVLGRDLLADGLEGSAGYADDID
ncbi:SsgA family sporulation/cell division regulator [Streptomyces sp. CG1]|uniref:SsgA family sporulation/cell division regulator n=1 Tax=Streptomyces sp. CG1 TaxID=1287523 RepID=UPI0034E2246E